MTPVLVTIGPLSIPSYGAMLLLAFLVGGVSLALELRRRALDPHLARGIVLLAVMFGLLGSKALALAGQLAGHAAPGLTAAWRDTMTWQGGLLAALAAIVVYVRAKGVSIGRVLDAGAPALMLAYGIGRLGCHLAGDGDYGLPTDLPWGARYNHGLVPPSQAFAGLPELVAQFPGRVVPDTTLCHPTPVYEFLGGVLGWLVLRAVARRGLPDGQLFMVYLVLSGVARFAVEFLRLNPRVALGLTEAQLLAVAMAVVGLVALVLREWRSGAHPSVDRLGGTRCPM
jgi:phosphatidylglycerol---prolipoprotein diacylglyceryl transferase